MGPIGTPKVVQKGSILRLLASQKGAKGPLWRPKGAKTSHCEAPGRFKWCPKAHLDGVGVPRCPPKLHFYVTDAQNWPQGLHFEGFEPQFVYSIVFFEYACVMFLLLQFSFDFLYCDVVAAATQHKHQEQIQTPLAEANNSSKTNLTSRSQHHLQNQHHQQNQTQEASSALPGEPSRTSGTSRSQCYQQNQCH